MSHDHKGAKVAQLGSYRVNLQTWEVSGESGRFRLPEKPFLVLTALLERPGEVVTRSELRERLWPDGTIVDFDNNLNSAVTTLRTAFGDSARSPRLIETLPRLGYRLIGEVDFTESDAQPTPLHSAESSGTPDAPKRSSRLSLRRAGMLTVAAGILLASGVYWLRQTQAEGTATSGDTEAVEVAPGDPAALSAWQRGIYLAGRGSVGDRTLALEQFEAVLRHEPGFAPAYIEIAETLLRMSFEGGIGIREGFSRGREAVNRALEITEPSADALRIRALADLHLDWDFAAAGRDLATALELAPQDANLYLAVATFLSAVGERDAAALAAERAVEFDPGSLLLRADLDYFLVGAGRYAEVREDCAELLKIAPDSVSVLSSCQVAAERLGHFEESVVAARRMMDLGGASEAELQTVSQAQPTVGLDLYRRWDLEKALSQANPSAFVLARRYAALGQKEEAFEHLEQAVQQRVPWLVYVHSYAQFESLRDDPRFAAIVGRMGAPTRGDEAVARILAKVELSVSDQNRLAPGDAFLVPKQHGLDQ